MSKLTMGRTRKKSKPEENGRPSAMPVRREAADAVFVFGAAAVCVMLALPMVAEERPAPREEPAVMVMSGAVEAQGTIPDGKREELVTPSNTEFEEEWNFYDYIGELFAGLLFGQS